MPEALVQTPALVGMNQLTEATSARISKALGHERAMRYGQEALSHLGIDQLQSAQDLLGLANYLILQSGIVEAVGRVLKVSAILRGAVDVGRNGHR